MQFNPASLGRSPAAADSTDPLGQPGGFEERVQPLRPAGAELLGEPALATDAAVMELVEVWGAGRCSDSFLRLSIAADGALPQQLRSLLLELPEEASGFRDLLLRPGYAFAASFMRPAAWLDHCAAGQPGPGPLLRPHCLLQGMAALARLLAQIEERSGLGWARPTAQALGLRHSQRYAPEGHALWQLQFAAWDQLEPGVATKASALAGLLQAPLAAAAEQAAAEGTALSRASLAEMQQLVAELEASPELSLSSLSSSLAAWQAGGLLLHAATDVGQRRKHNEDAYLLLEQEQCSAFGARFNLAAVADGMGGHSSGEVASSLALDLLRIQLPQLTLPPRSRPLGSGGLEADLGSVIQAAGRALEERAALDPAQSGMGTTLAGLARLTPHSTLTGSGQPECCIFNLGDSRVYLLAARGAARLSTDHSHVQELLDSGQIDAEQAFTHPQKNIITRCLGGGGHKEVRADLFSFEPAPGEIVLVCSDGLSDVLRDSEIGQLAAAVPADAEPKAYLAALARALIEAANAAGGPDNITVVLAAAQRRD